MPLKRTLVGMLTPSSNTVLEPYMCAILQQLLPEVTAHFQRFTVREISLDDKAMAQFRNESLIEAAKLLNDAIFLVNRRVLRVVVKVFQVPRIEGADWD